MASLVLGHLFFLRSFYCEFEFLMNRGHHGSQNTMGHLTGQRRDEPKEHAKGRKPFLNTVWFQADRSTGQTNPGEESCLSADYGSTELRPCLRQAQSSGATAGHQEVSGEVCEGREMNLRLKGPK